MMPTFLRLLAILAAFTTILVAMMSSSASMDRQIQDAEVRLERSYDTQAMLLRVQAAALSTQTAAAAVVAADRAGRDRLVAARADLERWGGAGSGAAAQADLALLQQQTGRLVQDANNLLDVIAAGGGRVARTDAANTLNATATSVATAVAGLLTSAGAEAQRAQHDLAYLRGVISSERILVTLAGLAFVLLLAIYNFLRTSRPFIALARQARRAVRPPSDQLPEFILDGPAPSEARDLAVALNSLVAQLREKYIELERANAELHERNAEAQSVSQAKTTFVNTISHELRTPLNSIIGFGEMLIEEVYGPVNEKQRQQLAKILRNSKQLLALINEVLDLARVEAGKVTLNLSPVDVAALLHAVATTIEPLAHQKGLALVLAIPEQLPPLVTDESRLRQVLLNLLSNAVKFTRDGTITLSTATEPHMRDWIHIRVTDTGIGIPASDLENIWQEFYQVSSGLSRTAGGSGLGLAIVRKLLALLGGDIEVESVEGQGSRFTVYLPLTPSETADGSGGASLYAATGVFALPGRAAGIGQRES